MQNNRDIIDQANYQGVGKRVAEHGKIGCRGRLDDPRRPMRPARIAHWDYGVGAGPFRRPQGQRRDQSFIVLGGVAMRIFSGFGHEKRIFWIIGRAIIQLS